MQTFILLLVSIVFSGCSSHTQESSGKYEAKTQWERREQKIKGKVFDGQILQIREDINEEVSLGVNTYLWRAALEILSSLEKSRIEPMAGLIETSWYTEESIPDERIKVEVLVSGRRLHTYSLQVTFHRQRLRGVDWVSMPYAESNARDLEDRILHRAREIRLQEEYI